MFPKQNPMRKHAVFAVIALVDAENGVVYTDLTGGFPVTSRAGNKYIMILYDYDSNGVHAEPMKNSSEAECLQAYEKFYKKLTKWGLKLSSISWITRQARRSERQSRTWARATS